MPEHSSVLYPLGSRRRWIESLLLLVAPPLITYAFAYVSLHFTSWAVAIVYAMLFFSIGPGIIFAQGFLSSENPGHIPWISNIAINLAHGAATEDGIRFRKWFRYHLVSWRGIARLEYWPEVDGRIVLHLYSQQSPVVFIPDAADDHNVPAAAATGLGAVDFISQKLSETWPGKSPFLICFEAPQTKAEGGIRPTRGNLSLRQTAWMNGLFLLVSLLTVLQLTLTNTDLRSRRGLPHKSFWTVVVGGWALLLIIWIWVRVFAKTAAPSPDQRKQLDRLKASNRS